MVTQETDIELLRVQWKDQGAKDVKDSLNTISNMAHSLTSAFMSLMTTTLSLQQSNLSLIQSYWSLADAKREINRLSERQFGLDIRQAELSLKLAQRQYLITQRTGRRLDVQMAQLRVQLASRDITFQQWQVEDKLRNTRRNMSMTEERLALQRKQMILQRKMLMVQYTLMIAQIGTMIMVTYQLIAAKIIEASVTTWGVGLAIMAGAVAGGIALARSITPDMPKESEVMAGETTGEIPGMQTKGAEVKQVMSEGLAFVHEGEFVHRGGGTTSTTINIWGNLSTAQEIVSEMVRKGLLHTETSSYNLSAGL